MSTHAKPSPPDTPARIHPGHRQDHRLGPAIGAAKGFRNINEHPLVAALALDRISADEFEAGDTYRRLYEMRFKASETRFEFSPSGGQNVPFSQTNVDAIRAIEAIESQLARIIDGPRYKTLIQRLCGEGYAANQACVAAGYTDPKQVWALTRLALNKLAVALERVERKHLALFRKEA